MSANATTKPLCKFFAAGNCHKGSKCWFSHEPAVATVATSKTLCKFFTAGNCHNGSKCWFSHEPAVPSASAAVSNNGVNQDDYDYDDDAIKATIKQEDYELTVNKLNAFTMCIPDLWEKLTNGFDVLNTQEQLFEIHGVVNDNMQSENIKLKMLALNIYGTFEMDTWFTDEDDETLNVSTFSSLVSA